MNYYKGQKLRSKKDSKEYYIDDIIILVLRPKVYKLVDQNRNSLLVREKELNTMFAAMPEQGDGPG